MRRSLLKVMCVVVLLCVAWIVISPDLDVAPTAFRFAVFAALTLFLLRCAFKYARPTLVCEAPRLLKIPPLETGPGRPGTIAAFIPLRC
jgi:hypothetical protein